jgi:hypothetical protein
LSFAAIPGERRPPLLFADYHELIPPDPTLLLSTRAKLRAGINDFVER